MNLTPFEVYLFVKMCANAKLISGEKPEEGAK